MGLHPQKALAALALVALPALAAPATAAAQQDSAATTRDSAATTRVETRTHTVRRGDTLWDLSHSYLGDPFLWPQIYRLNTTVVEDPHWIYPGERLVLPDAVVVASESERDSERDSARDSEPTADESVEATFATTTAAAPRSSVDAPRLLPRGRDQYSAVRAGEVYPAPFVDREGGPAGAGRIVQNVGETNIRSNLTSQALLLNDQVYITAPKGEAPAGGDRYLVYTLGARLEKLGQLIVPTGIVRIESAEQGTAPRARIIRQFGRILAGQYLMPLGAEAPPAGEAPTAVEGARPSATVVWIPDEPVLPSIQQYVVLDASARSGVRVGDEFTLVRPREANAGSLPLPEEPIAVAQVVRVTPYAATAIVLSQTHPAIRRGTRARISAKMP